MKDILIVRLSAIGDVALATSLLPGLRAKWPEARIHWVTEDMGAEVLRGNPEIDELIVLPRKKWKALLKSWRLFAFLREIGTARKRLRDIRAEMAIDAQGLLRSAFWAFASGARVRIGIRPQEGSRLLLTQSIAVGPNPTGRMCHGYRLLLEELGIDVPFSLCLRPTDESRSAAAKAMDAGTSAPVFFFPFTTRPQKHWFDDRWAELAAKTVRETGRRVWILGGPSNEAAARAIAEKSGVADSITVVAGRDSNIEGKMGLIERGAAAVGVDTGLSHISLGLGLPTVVLFGSTDIYSDTAPLPGIILNARMPCAPCNRHPICGGDFTCMKNLETGGVFAALKQLLDGRA